MARPTKPKDLKPKAEAEIATSSAPSSGGGGSLGLDVKFLVTIVAIVVASLAGSAGSAYFITPLVLQEAMKDIKITASAEDGGHGGGAEDDGEKVGMNLELDEFTVNLKEDPASPGTNQYLRAKLSMNIGVPSEEDCYHLAILPSQVAGAAAPIKSNTAAPIENSVVVNRTELASGAAPSGADTLSTCLDAFKNNMGKYVPTMRDVINAALMKRTAGTLSTLEGQEALKDEIKEEINLFMEEKYEVLRINFEDFVIQR